LPRPIFVVGHIRSGTTVLADLLRACCPRSIGLDSRDFEDRPFWQELGLAIGSPLTGTPCRGAGAPDVTDAQRAAIAGRLAAAAREGRHVVAKGPHLSNKIGFLDALVPGACVVHLVRQDLSVIASTKRRFLDSFDGANAFGVPFRYYWPDEPWPCWWAVPERGPVPTPAHEDPDEFLRRHPDPTRYFPGAGFARIAEAWVRITANIVRQVAALPEPRRCLHVNYRSLVERPRDVVAEIVEHAEIAASDLSRAPARLDASRADRWLTALDPEERGIAIRAVQAQREDLGVLRCLPGPLFVE
jgi:hypothetical protein